jgi:hypothetical protein
MRVAAWEGGGTKMIDGRDGIRIETSLPICLSPSTRQTYGHALAPDTSVQYPLEVPAVFSDPPFRVRILFSAQNLTVTTIDVPKDTFQVLFEHTQETVDAFHSQQTRA